MRVTIADYPAAKPFYVLAMRLSKFQSEYFQTDQEGSGEIANYDSQADRNKRSHCWFWTTHCRSNGRCCYRCPSDDNCLGLCGRGCSCWWWVCGNCCYNQGCYDHDICCGSWNSWGCQIPLGFSCSSYDCYSDSSVPWS